MKRELLDFFLSCIIILWPCFRFSNKHPVIGRKIDETRWKSQSTFIPFVRIVVMHLLMWGCKSVMECVAVQWCYIEWQKNNPSETLQVRVNIVCINYIILLYVCVRVNDDVASVQIWICANNFSPWLRARRHMTLAAAAEATTTTTYSTVVGTFCVCINDVYIIYIWRVSALSCRFVWFG